jgi:hypothetical protein
VANSLSTGIRLERKLGRGTPEVRVVNTETEAIKAEFDGFVRVVDEPAKPKASGSSSS